MTAKLDAIEIDMEVPFHDVDGIGVVWHGHYFKYLEIARTALMRAKGLDVEDFIRLGFGLVVIDARCRYTFPLRYGDKFRVQAWLADVDNRIRVRYEVWNDTHQRRSAKGDTVLVVTDLSGNLLLRTPDAIRERFI